jgi:hypothetical protein
MASGSTPINELPYLMPGDAPDVAGVLELLTAKLDRSLVPDFTSITARDATIPAPSHGMVCSVQNRFLYWHDGVQWQPVVTNGSFTQGRHVGPTGVPNAYSFTVDHNLGVIPNYIEYHVNKSGLITGGGGASASGAFNFQINGSSTTQFIMEIYNSTTGALFATPQPVDIYWRAWR